MIETITSIKDQRITLARELKSLRGRKEQQKILLEGEEILDWAVEKHIAIDYILVSDKAVINIGQKYISQDIPVFAVSEGLLKKVTDTNYVIPVVGVAQVPLAKTNELSPFIIVLNAVQDFGNIGTIIRTCQAFGIKDILNTATDFDIYQRKTIEASRGTVFSTHVKSFANDIQTINYLKENGYQIVATSLKGTELQSLVNLKRQPVALVVGNETNGISEEFEKSTDFLVKIPMFHTVESLNVGVATGISIYELKLKQVLAMIEERIKSTLGRELNVAGMLVQRALDAELNKVTELSSQQVIFMMVLKCDRHMLVTDMCKQFGILESEADTFLKPMLADGLVVNNGDLQLTTKGEEVLSKLWFTIESTESKIISGLTSEEITKMMALLRQIQEQCVRIMQGD